MPEQQTAQFLNFARPLIIKCLNLLETSVSDPIILISFGSTITLKYHDLLNNKCIFRIKYIMTIDVPTK